MEWIILFVWLLVINGGLGGQYILNWMGNQPEYVGNQPVGVSPGVMTWWREISKFAWAFIASITELVRGKKIKYFWPGTISMITIMICGFTGVIENIGFFYLPRYYSPHIYAPYVNVYLILLPFFGKMLFNAPIRKEHWIGAGLVVAGLIFPHSPRIFGAVPAAGSVLDLTAIIWILIINGCLLSQQVLNNKTVQTAMPGVGPNALVLWREIWKMIFISSALLFFPLMAGVLGAHLPSSVPVIRLETEILPKLDKDKQEFILHHYDKIDGEYVIQKDLPSDTQDKLKEIFKTTDTHRFFSLFEGSIFPNNWLPILFVVAAGLTGYIYSFGFFKLSKYAAHFWVPYTNLWLGFLPFIMLLFGKNVTVYQIIGAALVTAGLMVGVSDYNRHKVSEIKKKYEPEIL